MLLKETWQFRSRQLVAENLLAVFVHSVDLEGLFDEVQTNRANPFHFLLPGMMWEDYNSGLDTGEDCGERSVVARAEVAA